MFFVQVGLRRATELYAVAARPGDFDQVGFAIVADEEISCALVDSVIHPVGASYLVRLAGQWLMVVAMLAVGSGLEQEKHVVVVAA